MLSSEKLDVVFQNMIRFVNSKLDEDVGLFQCFDLCWIVYNGNSYTMKLLNADVLGSDAMKEYKIRIDSKRNLHDDLQMSILDIFRPQTWREMTALMIDVNGFYK